MNEKERQDRMVLAASRGTLVAITTTLLLPEAAKKFNYEARTFEGDTFETAFEWARSEKKNASRAGVAAYRPKCCGEHAERALKTIHEIHTPHCEDPECLICGVLACIDGEPMHFHHDGCPAACDESEPHA